MDIPEYILQSYTDESISSIHHILRSSRRRLAIMLISHRSLTANPPDMAGDDGHGGPDEINIPARNLAREITAIEEEIPLSEATGEQYRNVYTSLIQSHLPRLDDSNIIHYDPDRKTIEPGENLLAVAVITAITSPVSQMLLHHALADLYTERGGSMGSIGN